MTSSEFNEIKLKIISQIISDGYATSTGMDDNSRLWYTDGVFDCLYSIVGVVMDDEKKKILNE